MRGLVLLASLGLALAALTAAPPATRADDGWPRLRLPQIIITPNPAPDAVDYGQCLSFCADRHYACVRASRRRSDVRECRLQQSLCESSCTRYARSEH
jgi:hypothetical protein